MAASKTPKERLLVALRKGRADHVAALLDQVGTATTVGCKAYTVSYSRV